MKRLALLAATGWGTGYCPVAPGTAGTAGAVLFLGSARYLVLRSGWTPPLALYCLLVAGLLAGGAAICTMAEKELGPDSPRIVLDEMVGMWMALFMVPFRGDTVLAAFICFRFFDIVKVYPIKKMEKIPGGWGVMMDDVLAGIITNLLVHGYVWIRGI